MYSENHTLDDTAEPAPLIGEVLPPETPKTPHTNSSVLGSGGLIYPKVKIDKLTLITSTSMKS